MDKLYHRINYENSPSKKTPLSEANLNKMDKAIDDLDNRIVEQDAKFAKSIESEDKKIEDVNGKVSELTDTAATLTQSKSDAITVEKSGTTIIATDSSDKGFEQFRTYGWSEQEKTSGKNLYNKELYPLVGSLALNTNNGSTYSVSSGDYSATQEYIPFDKHVGKTIAASQGIFAMCFYDGSKNFISHINFNVDLYGVVPSNTKYMRFDCAKTHVNIAQVEYGTVATDYEPYTGNIPSPNPEYEQPIVSAGQKLALGKQWFDKDTRTNGSYKHYNSGSVIVNADFFYSDYIKVSQGNYTVSGISVNDPHVCFYDANKNYLSGVLARNFTVPQDGYMVFSAPIVDADNIMLNSGSTALPWEPYTAGVKKAVDVGIRKKLTGKNQIDVNATTRQLLNHSHGAPDNTSQWLTTDFLEVKGNVATLSVNNPSDNFIVRFCEYDSQKVFLRNVGNPVGVYGDESKTIELLSNTKYVRLSFGFNNRSCTPESYIASGNVIQLEYDSEATPYEPYTEQTLTLNRVLRGIPVTDASLANYTDENGQMWCADYGDVERKVWVQKVGVSVLNGVGNYLTNGPANTYCVNVDDMMKLEDYTGMILCDQYLCNAKSNTYAVDKCVTGYYDSKNSYPTQNWVYIRDSSYANVTELKNALKAKPITVYYPLVTPIETPMTDEEIAAYKALHSYKPTTVITNDADAYMEVEYVADTKTHIEQNYVPVSKYTALEDRVSALERLHV